LIVCSLFQDIRKLYYSKDKKQMYDLDKNQGGNARFRISRIFRISWDSQGLEIPKIPRFSLDKNTLGGNSRLQDFKTSKDSKDFTGFHNRDFKFSQNFKRLLKTSKDCQRLQEISRDFTDFIGLHWTSLDFTGLHQTPLDIIGLHWTSPVFIRLHWTSLGFTRLHRTSKDFR
jgi:hypothetical protein